MRVSFMPFGTVTYSCHATRARNTAQRSVYHTTGYGEGQSTLRDADPPQTAALARSK